MERKKLERELKDLNEEIKKLKEEVERSELFPKGINLAIKRPFVIEQQSDLDELKNDILSLEVISRSLVSEMKFEEVVDFKEFLDFFSKYFSKFEYLKNWAINSLDYERKRISCAEKYSKKLTYYFFFVKDNRDKNTKPYVYPLVFLNIGNTPLDELSRKELEKYIEILRSGEYLSERDKTLVDYLNYLKDLNFSSSSGVVRDKKRYFNYFLKDQNNQKK